MQRKCYIYPFRTWAPVRFHSRYNRYFNELFYMQYERNTLDRERGSFHSLPPLLLSPLSLSLSLHGSSFRKDVSSQIHIENDYSLINEDETFRSQ